MSLMLLAASFLMFRGFQHSLSEGLEFAEQAKDHVLMVRFDPRLVQYDASRTERFYELLAERVRAGARSPERRRSRRTLRSALGDFGRIAFVPEGFQMPRDRESFRSPMDTVDEGYFETMGIPILRGRGFRSSDAAGAPRVAIVNEQFANHYWPGADPVGKRIRLESAERRAGRDRRRRADDQVRRRPRGRDRFRLRAVRPASRRAHGPAGALGRRPGRSSFRP